MYIYLYMYTYIYISIYIYVHIYISHVWRDSYSCVTCLSVLTVYIAQCVIQNFRLIFTYTLAHTHILKYENIVRDMTPSSFETVCDVAFDVTWLFHTCNMTHSYVWHEPLMCVTWRIHVCDMTHPYMRHDSCVCVTWLDHMCGMTYSYVWHDASICVACLMDICAMTPQAQVLCVMTYCVWDCLTYCLVLGVFVVHLVAQHFVLKTHIRTNSHTIFLMHKSICIHSGMYVYVRVYVCIYIYMYLYVYIYMYIYIYEGICD